MSVIIPVLDDADGLRRCVTALADQDYPAELLEVLIVDNGSKKPVFLTRIYPFEIRYLECDRPGSYAARNDGIHAASGEVLVFTDADCCPASDWLRAGIAKLVASRSHTIVGGEVEFSTPSRITTVARYQMLVGFGQKQNIEIRNFTATANMFCRSASFEQVGLFSERLMSGGDREWCWRAVRRGHQVSYAADVLVGTLPRTELGRAVRQVRRVAGGRHMLKRMGAATADIQPGMDSVEPPRWTQSIRTILMHSSEPAAKRLQIFCVAILLKAVAWAENLRLILGRTAEHR